MNERETYEFDAGLDGELDRALYAALARQPAPASLMTRVEQRLLRVEAERAVPTFGPLNLGVRNAWMSLWSIGAHASALALIALVVFAGGKEIAVSKHAEVTPVEVRPFLP